MARTRLNNDQIRQTPINSNFAVQGARFTTSSLTLVDVPGCSFNYTSGPTAEALYLWAEAMCSAAAGQNMQWTLSIGGADQTVRAYHDGSGLSANAYQRYSRMYIYNIPANTTVTIKLRAMVSGGTGNVVNDNAVWVPTVTGYAIAQ